MSADVNTNMINTYMKYIFEIHTCITYMKYAHVMQPQDGGMSVTGTPQIAFENIWRVLTYAVFHAVFEFPNLKASESINNSGLLVLALLRCAVAAAALLLHV